MLAETFKSLVNHYTNNSQHAQTLWEEIVKNYSDKGRHYHTLDHLSHLLTQIQSCKDYFKDMDAVLFALYYHDAVYDVLRKDNEEKSAALAVKRLSTLNVPSEKIEACKHHILATQAHIVSSNSDTNLFTDADLSILGQDWDTYQTYFHKVRNEYAVYPDLLYRPGRRKVLEHFLRMERIFKTEFFRDKYENQARVNMKKELDLL